MKTILTTLLLAVFFAGGLSAQSQVNLQQGTCTYSLVPAGNHAVLPYQAVAPMIYGLKSNTARAKLQTVYLAKFFPRIQPEALELTAMADDSLDVHDAYTYTRLKDITKVRQGGRHALHQAKGRPVRCPLGDVHSQSPAPGIKPTAAVPNNKL